MELITSEEEFREQLFNFSRTLNLNNLVNFHDLTNIYIHQAIDETEHLDEDDIPIWRDYHEQHFPEMLRVSVFLMMFGHIEEHLYLIHQHSKIAIEKKSGLDRYKPLLRRAFGSELGSCKSWSYLQDASQVRHALLHAAGRVSLMRNSDDLKRIAKQRSKSFTIKRDRIQVETEGLHHLAKQTGELLMELYSRLSARLD